MKSGILIIFGIIDKLSLLEKLNIDNKKTSLLYLVHLNNMKYLFKIKKLVKEIIETLLDVLKFCTLLLKI